jgi:DNA-binding ferritin-like protein (Dps family)
MIEDKKRWRAHIAWVKKLPRDYQIVYGEIQKYLWKIGPVELGEGDISLLIGILELFEEGAANGQKVLEITGPNVANFADDLVKDMPTFAEKWIDETNETVAKSMQKYTDKIAKKTAKEEEK